MQKLFKKERGITLIALVITVIILIILAGVSINILFNEDGLINKAKQAKEDHERGVAEEQEILDQLTDYAENLGKTKTVEELKTKGTYMPKKTTLKDSDNNLIVVPEGFRIASDSGINVTEGIVIEDNDIIEGVGNGRGNQYVWIPVGENIKKSDGSEIDITLGRYVFADGTNHKDGEGNKLVKGTPILKQSADDYEDETGIKVKEINPTSTLNLEYKELKTNREGESSSGLNIIALDLKGFIDSVKDNGGYYIARYEASYGVDGKANSKVSIETPVTSNSTIKTEGMLWNFITQIDAATASRNLYTTINSDLINSYAWDTAIVYIQEFSDDTDYSRQTSINTSLANTGVNNDVVCKIHDMASNTYEWTTEFSTSIVDSNAYPCTHRGGYYDSTNNYMSYRSYYSATGSGMGYTFRSTLYL